jgi:uncharacterized protein
MSFSEIADVILINATGQNLLLSALYLAAGFGLFCVLLGRFFLQMEESWTKAISIRLLFISCIVAFPLIGIFHAPAWMALLPAVLILIGILTEARRLKLLAGYKAAPAVERQGRRLSLFRPLTTYDLVTHRYEAPAATLAHGRIRVAHISDFHIHPYMKQSFFRQMMEQVNSHKPDLIFITGDFVMGERNIPLLKPVIELARPRVAAFGCMGNHDYWLDTGKLMQLLEASGLRILQNKHQRIEIPGAGTVVVSGCDDPWTGHNWTPPALNPGESLFVLSHTADNIYRLSNTDVTAVFSGHYHSGHLSFPLFGPLVIPSRYGRLFHQGHFKVKNTHLFVTAGIGSAVPPVRIYCQPEVQIIDFVPNK